jgi:hypothetical protein
MLKKTMKYQNWRGHIYAGDVNLLAKTKNAIKKT